MPRAPIPGAPEINSRYVQQAKSTLVVLDVYPPSLSRLGFAISSLATP